MISILKQSFFILLIVVVSHFVLFNSSTVPQEVLGTLGTVIDLPRGGGGPAADIELWGEFSALLACSSGSGVFRNSSLPLALPRDLPESVFGGFPPMRVDYPRLAIIAAFAEYVKEVPELASDGFLSVLSFSPGLELGLVRPRLLEECRYEENGSKCDLHEILGSSLRNAPFDFTLISQTVEHLYDPPLAIARLYDLLAPGGMLFVSMPAWNIEHMLPSHQQGLLPCGIFALLRNAGFELARLGWYGSEAYSHALVQPGGDWPSGESLHMQDPFVAIPHDSRGYVNHVWALAQKPKTVQERVPRFIPDARPRISPEDMTDASFAKQLAYHNKPLSGTLLSLLFNHPQWLDGDAANVVLAAALMEHLNILLGVSPAVLSHFPAAPFLTFGATARALGALLPAAHANRVQPWTDALDTNAYNRSLASGAVVSDLFESRSDPLGTLLSLFRNLAPDSPVFISCRTADVLNVSRPSLGTCTVDGLLQLVTRAGCIGPVEDWRLGRWGTAAYAHAAIARGEYLSPRSLMCCSGRWRGPAVFSECLRPDGFDPRLALALCPPAETRGPSFGDLLTKGLSNDADALLRALEPAAHDLLLAGTDENNWAAVAWVIVKTPPVKKGDYS